MAKLSARGRYELARVSKETTKPDLVPCDGCEGTGTRTSDLIVGETAHYKKGDFCSHCEGKGQTKPLTTWEKRTLALMSDRTVLIKLDVRFQPDMYDKEGRFYSYGWKVKGKAKEGVDAARFIEIYTKVGWKQEKVR